MCNLHIYNIRTLLLFEMESLPETYEDLPDKRRFWPAPAGSEEEGLGMLRLLTPDIVAAAARAEIQTGERVCLNWDLDKLELPGIATTIYFRARALLFTSSQDSGAENSTMLSNGSMKASRLMMNTISIHSSLLNGTGSATTVLHLQMAADFGMAAQHQKRY